MGMNVAVELGDSAEQVAWGCDGGGSNADDQKHQHGLLGYRVQLIVARRRACAARFIESGTAREHGLRRDGQKVLHPGLFTLGHNFSPRPRCAWITNKRLNIYSRATWHF